MALALDVMYDIVGWFVLLLLLARNLINLFSPLVVLVGGFVLLLLLARNLIAPLVVLASFTMPARHSFEEIPWEEFISSRTPEYLHLCQQVESLGFCPAASSKNTVSGSYTYFTVFSHPTSTAIATLVSSVNIQGETLALEFTQAYADGMHLDVTNSPMPFTFPSWKRNRIYRAPGVSRPDELYRLFVAIVGKVRDRQAIRFIQGRELEEIARFSDDRVRRLVRIGFLRVSPDGMTARYTLWSAYYASWRLLWPLSSILNRLDKRATYAAAA